MSLEAALAEHTEALKANTAVTQANTAICERLVAGQSAAMEKLAEKQEAARTGKAPTAAEKKAAEKAAEVAAAAAAKPETTPPVTTGQKVPTNTEEMKAYISGWTGSTDNADERAARVQFLKDLAKHFGVNPAMSELVPHAKLTVFYIERKKAGQPVDFSADYDFEGDPAQGGGEPAAAAEAEETSDFD